MDKPLDSSIKTRAAVSLSFALVSAYFSRAAQLYLSKSPGGDFLWAMRAGAELLQGKDPYAHSFGPYSIPYPLPAAFVGLPFSLFDPATGAGLFFGISVGLLTYGLMVHHQTRLLIFISLPFWFALVWAQWSPLAMAAAFFPLLMPVVLIKPQIALPVAITYRTRLGTYLCIGVLPQVLYFIQNGQLFGFRKSEVINGSIRGQRHWDHFCSWRYWIGETEMHNYFLLRPSYLSDTFTTHSFFGLFRERGKKSVRCQLSHGVRISGS